ncbi:hypothetical protein FACS189454_05100 [Planctomycetales bacterium]|nr:hypothetical protein FACS189454_05100 [Planctomycetales bacterium]
MMNTIIDQARNGDTAAFAKIVKQYQAIISGVLFNVTGDFHKSEDLAQETFLIAWKKLADLKNTDDILPWLCAIARNLANRSFRKQQPLNQLGYGGEIADNKSSDATEPSNEMIRREQSEMVWAAVAEIPESQREALVLFYRTGQSVHEIAAATEVSEDAVRQRLHRARLSLKSKLEEIIGGVLTSTAPGEAFTLGVMAAVTGAVLIQTAAAATAVTTTAVTTTAATKTTAGTGSAVAGGAIGFAAFLKIFGALGWLVWMFALVFFSQWTAVQNTPTLRARRFPVYTFFLFCQYVGLVTIGMGVLAGLGLAALFAIVGEKYVVTTGSVSVLPFAILLGILCSSYLQGGRRKIIESDLGLREYVKSYSFRQVERRFHQSFIPNILIIETICGAGLIFPLIDGHGSLILVFGTLGLTCVLSLILYTYYIFGINFMKLCRSDKSMRDYPPLLDDPFEIALGRKFKSPISIDHSHRREAGRLNYLKYILWIGMGGAVLLMLYSIDWSNQPVLTVGGMLGIALGLFISNYLNKQQIESLKNQYLFTVVLAIYNIGCALLMANTQRGSATLQEYLQSAFMAGYGCVFQNALVIFLLINVIGAILSFVQWIRIKPEVVGGFGSRSLFNVSADKYDAERLREAIANYKPTDTEDEPEMPAFSARKWFWICFIYGAILLAIFAVFCLIPNPIAERKMLERNGNYSKLIELYPDNPVYYISRSNQQNTLERQLADLNKAIQLKPDYAKAYSARASARSNAAHGFLGEQRIEQPTEDVKKLYRLALADADEAVRLDPDLYWAWRVRAGIHADGFKDYEAAIADCSEMIRIQPKNEYGYDVRAMYYAQSGNHDAAITDYTKAIELTMKNAADTQRRNPMYHADRADQYAAKGDWKKAGEDYAEAIRLAKAKGDNPLWIEQRYNQLLEKQKRKAGQ